MTRHCACECRCVPHSVARKMGAAVFCTFEDIVGVKGRMIMNLIASVMLVDKNRRAQGLTATGGPVGGAGGPSDD